MKQHSRRPKPAGSLSKASSAAPTPRAMSVASLPAFDKPAAAEASAPNREASVSTNGSPAGESQCGGVL